MLSVFLTPILVAATLSIEGLTITPSFEATRWIEPRDRIELRLSRPVDTPLAVFVGNRDITPLFESTPGVLRYRTGVPPLPAGEQELIVYAAPVGAEWKEIGRFPIKVLTRRGFQKSMAKPSLDLTNKGQLDTGQTPPESFSTREQYQDLTGQGGFTTEHQRGDLTFRTQTNLSGVSYRNEALRFGEKGESAPLIDLSNYKIEIQKGTTSLALGHVAFGGARHLINGFSSRGAILTFGAGRPVSFSLGAMNGTSIVGWDNILGIHETEHRMYGASVGFELVPKRPGAVHLELSYLDGSLLPLNAFTGGGIKSAEKSRGSAVRLTMASPAQRFTIDGGWTRSRFTPQRDAELEDGLLVTAIPAVERDAAFLDATFAILPPRQIGSQQLGLSATLNIERVEPLYRSVGTSAQADWLRGAISLNSTLGPVTLQLAHIQSEDNLEDIRSILKSKTRQSSANIALSLAALFGSKRGARWIPALTASIDHTHQYGAWLPVNSGFSESHVPDQTSTSAQTGIEWSVKPLRFGVRGSLSRQNNRQPGRTRSDFETGAGTLFVGFNPIDRFEVGLESSLEEQKNIEFATREGTRRAGVTMTWRMIGDVALAGNHSETFGRDGARTNEKNASESFLELSSGFRLWRSAQRQNRSRLFVRYSNRESSSFDRLFGTSSENDGWALTSGVNLSVY